MSISQRVLRIVARSLKSVHLCKKVLVVSPTTHILRGFLIDRTMRKNMYNLWKVVAPLYRPMRFLILNYSETIGPPTEWLTIKPDEIKDAADRVTQYILDGHFDQLQQLRGPREFMEHVSWMVGNTTDPFRFDYAMTQYLLGNRAACLETLQALIADERPDASPSHFCAWAKQIVPKIETNPSEVEEILRNFEQANIEMLALSPTLIDRDRPRE